MNASFLMRINHLDGKSLLNSDLYQYVIKRKQRLALSLVIMKAIEAIK